MIHNAIHNGGMEKREYPTIIEYAEAIADKGEHDANVMGQNWSTKDGVVFAAKGGFGYTIADLTGDDPTLVESVRRTAALARYRAKGMWKTVND